MKVSLSDAVVALTFQATAAAGHSICQINKRGRLLCWCSMVCTRRKKNILVKQKDISSNGPLLLLLFFALQAVLIWETFWRRRERDWRRHSSALWSKWSDWLIAKQILQHRLHRHRKRVESSNLVRVVIFAELLGGEQQRESRAKYFSRDESYGPK